MRYGWETSHRRYYTVPCQDSWQAAQYLRASVAEHCTGKRRKGRIVMRIEAPQDSAYSRRELNEGARV